MAANEEVDLDASESDSFMKCCSKQKCAVLVCINCFAVYHKSCAKRLQNVKLLNENKVICCNKLNQVTRHDKEDEESQEKELLKMEIKYLKEIIEEIKDKNNILKLNNELLVHRINLEQKQVDSKRKNGHEKNPNISNQKFLQQNHSRGSEEICNVQTNVTTIQENSDKISQQVAQGAVQKQTSSFSEIVKNKNYNINRNEGRLAMNSDNDNIRSGSNNNLKHNNVEIEKKRVYGKKSIGTGVVNNEGFSGVEKKVWLYLYRVKPEANEEKVTMYIKNKPGFENSNIYVKEIPTDNKISKRYVVTAPFQKKDELYKPEFWPNGVGIKRFNFSIHKDFLNQQQTGDFL